LKQYPVEQRELITPDDKPDVQTARIRTCPPRQADAVRHHGHARIESLHTVFSQPFEESRPVAWLHD
jgi:hypothetical protein